MNLSDQNGNFTNTTQQSSTSYTTRTLKPLAKEFFFIALGMQWLNVVLIITLNIAVIVTVLRRPKKSRLYFLLMNMAIADLMTGLHVTDALANAMERTAGMQYIDYMWLADDTLCKFQRWISNTCCVASNYILAATSVDRALVVVKPLLNFKRGYILQKSLIAACWFLSSAVNSPYLFFSERKIKRSTVFIATDIIICGPAAFVFDHYKETVNLLFLFYVGLPLMVIIVSYAVLIHAIYKRARTPPHSMMRGMNPLKFPMIFNRGLPSSKARSIKLTLGIVLSFILSWTPYMVTLYGGAYGLHIGPITMLFVTAYYWNSVANPIVFFVFHKRSLSSSSASSLSPRNKTFISLDNRKTPERMLEDAEAVPTCIT